MITKLVITNELHQWVQSEATMTISQAWNFCENFISVLVATQPPAENPTDYHRPQVSQNDVSKIAQMVRRATNTHRNSAEEIRSAFFLVCIENARLLAEVNEHRAARGLAPLPVHEPR